MKIRVFNYNTLDKVHTFEAHTDYIRCLAVHPSQPYLLSCSDDMTIRMWDWEQDWTCRQVFEGHSHYVMDVCFVGGKMTCVTVESGAEESVCPWEWGQQFGLMPPSQSMNLFE